MTSTPSRRTPARLLTVLAATATAGALSLSTPAAHASDISDADNVSLTPSSSGYVDGALVDIDQSGLAANTEYTVSICEWDTYTTFLIAQIPACIAGTSQVDVTTDGSGNLHVDDYELLAGGANAHAFLGPSQPANVDCDAHLCEVVVTPAHGGGSGGSYAGDSAEFNVS